MSALSATDQRYLAFEEALARTFLAQRRDECRSFDDTLTLAWRALASLPRRELTMLPAALVDEYLGGPDGGAHG